MSRHLRALPPPPEESDDQPSPRRQRPAWRQGPAREKLLNDPRFAWTRSRPGRRAVTVGYAATVAVSAAAVWHSTHRPALIAVPVLVLPAMVVLIGLLNIATRGITDLTDPHLDERQRAIRERAYRRAYRLVAAAASAAYAALIVASVTGTLPTAPGPWLALGFSGFCALWQLPTVVVAWIEED